MELYFLRHAIAAERAEAKVKNDSERPLTAEGVQKMKEIASGMRKLGVTVDEILSSPYERARHTAELAAAGIGHAKKIRFTDALTPIADFKDFSKTLKTYDEKARLLLVGHQPTLGHFLSELIAGHDVFVDFKKGGLCLVETFEMESKLKGELKWLLTPRQLRALA